MSRIKSLLVLAILLMAPGLALAAGQAEPPKWSYIEVGYIDFGKAQASGTLAGTAVSREMSGNATYLAFVLRGTFFDRLTVYGKAGADYWQATGNLGSSFSTSQNANGTGFMYGVGASFRIVGPLGVIAEAERYQNVGDQGTTGQANINAFSLGLVVRF